MTTTPTPPMEDDVKPIRDAIRALEDCGIDSHAYRLAELEQECAPARIARLLAHIDAQAVRLEAAENALSDFRADLADALCQDCESGVKSLNEKNLAKFKGSYKNLYAAIASEAKP